MADKSEERRVSTPKDIQTARNTPEASLSDRRTACHKITITDQSKSSQTPNTPHSEQYQNASDTSMDLKDRSDQETISARTNLNRDTPAVATMHITTSFPTTTRKTMDFPEVTTTLVDSDKSHDADSGTELDHPDLDTVGSLRRRSDLVFMRMKSSPGDLML